MRRFLMAIVFLSLAAPSLVSAQRWTGEEQDLLTHVKACWDAILAKDIKRRFLPKFHEFYELAMERKRQHEEYVAN